MSKAKYHSQKISRTWKGLKTFSCDNSEYWLIASKSMKQKSIGNSWDYPESLLQWLWKMIRPRYFIHIQMKYPILQLWMNAQAWCDFVWRTATSKSMARICNSIKKCRSFHNLRDFSHSLPCQYSDTILWVK